MKQFGFSEHSSPVSYLTETALFTALVTLSTMFIHITIPATGGYVHLGDSLVLLSGFLLGPVYGGLAAGLGSALSDLLLGAAHFALPTFVIKGVMGFFVGAAYQWIKEKYGHPHRLTILLIGTLAEAWMVAGYFLTECVLYTPVAAATGILPNTAQGIFGAFAAFAAEPFLMRLQQQTLQRER